MRVLAAMSGGVDSSVAAALLRDAGHDVVGVTLKLWDNPGDGGCCSVLEIEDARRVAQQLGIDHWVFGFTDEFEARVVGPYAEAHAAGLTPNPCIECNRHLKFGRLLRRARQLGFDTVATGHHARVGRAEDGTGEWELRRGADATKDQSYVLYVLGQDELARCLVPVGALTKAEGRATARRLGLRTADKPDSQDVCFVATAGGRGAFLAGRIPLHPGRVVDREGAVVGRVDAVELVTVGQRRGLGTGGGALRFALDVDPAAATVTVGSLDDLVCDRIEVSGVTWVGSCWPDGPVDVQTSAHGVPVPGWMAGEGTVVLERPARRVAPGQSVVLYRGDRVLGGGIAR